MSTSRLLAVVALVFAALSYIVPGYPLLTIAVILLACSHLV